jgi:Flp pilus assembly protein TadD/mono/diheme cytochrome c family protein
LLPETPFLGVAAARLAVTAGAILASAVASIGCSGPSASSSPDSPTFTRDIAPIVFTRCAACHRPGEAGPFPLLTYADVRQRARQIAEVTSSRYMPPWKPEPGHGEFIGERRLTEAQIATIRRWVERGAPEGDLADLPAAPSFPQGWQLGTPDLVVSMPAPVEVPADGADRFRTVLVPVRIEAQKYVRAVEFRPGNPRAVHHAMVRIRTPQSALRDPQAASGAARPAVRVIDAEGMLGSEEDIISPDGHVLGWAPGYSPTVMPDGMAWRIEPGTDLAIELHLQTTGKPEQVQSTVGLFFTSEAPTRAPFGLQLGSYTLDIPPGARDYVVEDRYELPVDVVLHAVYPHAHYLGKDLRAFAVTPDGREQSLIWIRDWDFNWQNAYRYRSPIQLPRGTIIRMRYTYDNSAANPRNPSSPPKRVRYGGQSSDEMANLWMQVEPANPRDLSLLRSHYDRKSAERDLEGFAMLARERPGHAGIRRALGAAYLRLGRVDEALPTLREAVRLEPRDATARYNLGHVLLAKGEVAEAAAQFREAARLEPSFAEAHNNLGALLRQSGDLAGAERAFLAAIEAAPDYAPAHSNLGATRRRRGNSTGAARALETAVRLDPASADAHLNLGLVYQQMDDRPAATRHLRRAIELRPSGHEAYNALAWLLATAPDSTPAARAEAVALAERAAALTEGRDASVLDTLAAAAAGAGDLARAAAIAERAVQAAAAAGQRQLAADIERRLQTYRRQ